MYMYVYAHVSCCSTCCYIHCIYTCTMYVLHVLLSKLQEHVCMHDYAEYYAALCEAYMCMYFTAKCIGMHVHVSFHKMMQVFVF